MSFKDILVLAVSLREDQAALRAAQRFALANRAGVKVLISPLHPGSWFTESHAPLSLVIEDIAKGPAGAAETARREIETWLTAEATGFSAANLNIEDALLDPQILNYARYTDVVLMTRPAGEADRVRWALWESVLFGSGRPVILTPRDWAGNNIGKRILIAWNAKREASRAVADAMPLIKQADQVVVATVDAVSTYEGHGERPGEDLARHLARHAKCVDIQNLDGLGRRTSERLIECAEAIGADLIVMGGYSHTRAHEWLLGGVTREMASSSPIPVLMSH